MSVNYSNINPTLTAAGIHEHIGIGTASFALQMDQPLAANVLFEFVTQWKERRSNVRFSIITQNDLSEKNCTCTVSTERKQGEKISFMWPNPRHRGRSGDQVKEKESWQWEWSECRKEARLCACSSASYVSVFVKHALVQLSFRAICAFMAYAKKHLHI